jgi:hypothetical protein
MMNKLDYPALYLSADKASNSFQALYLGLIKIEYLLLLIAAVFSIEQLASTDLYIIYVLVLLAATAVLLFRSVK